MHSFMSARPSLKRVYLLIDARRGVMESDIDFMNKLDALQQSYQLVLTKVDSIRSDKQLLQIALHTRASARLQKFAEPEILAASAKKQSGIPEMRLNIVALLGMDPPVEYTAKYPKPPSLHGPVLILPDKMTLDETESAESDSESTAAVNETRTTAAKV
eukprot:TRINITY_DN4203_c0_g1_i1.p1 TRINITY_DN4203_c0_g1~~TRINITY_DN4203_c0_g1_i1.p1  ORF type:complete len:159 (+),score=34.93 TRINITY_DN4203_c0_g1_i1:657-1133(+)